MRGILFFAFLFIQVISFSQTKEGAELSFKDNSFDFGHILEDKGIVKHTFVFTNTGTEALAITNVRTTCGCTVPSWTKSPVSPGAEGYVEIAFDPKKRPGAFHKTVQVQSTAQNANMFVTISGTVIPPLKMEVLPYKLGDLNVKSNHVNLGYLYKGNTGTENLVIANKTDKPIEVDFENIPAYIALLVSPQILQPGEYGQIEVQFCTEKTNEWDVVVDQVPVLLNGRRDDQVKLTITANIREDFSKLSQEQMKFAPVATYIEDVVDYDTISQENPVACQFQIRNDGQSDLIIRSVKPSCGCTAVKPEKNVLKPGDFTYIDAVFYPKGRSGDFKNGITIVTNDPLHYKKHVFIEGFIKH